MFQKPTTCLDTNKMLIEIVLFRFQGHGNGEVALTALIVSAMLEAGVDRNVRFSHHISVTWYRIHKTELTIRFLSNHHSSCKILFDKSNEKSLTVAFTI